MNSRCSLVPLALALTAIAAVPQEIVAQQIDSRLQEAIAWYTGTGGTVDDSRAHDLLVEAAATDDPITRMWVARVYSRGRMEFERDEPRARELASEVIDRVRALADQSVAEAAFLMGTAFDEGLGVSVDPARAAAWYHRAADLGNVLAQHNLGNIYEAGRGVPQSDSHAVYWWRRAAEQGDAIPQWHLGQAYERGVGVAADREQALRWYHDAATRGNRQARAALERLGASSPR